MTSTTDCIDDARIIKTSSTVVERVSQFVATTRRNGMVGKLRKFLEGLEKDLGGCDWTTLHGPFILFMADLCDSLKLTDQERAEVLGRKGESALNRILETRYHVRPVAQLNDRQNKALSYVEYRGKIGLSAYRKLCPGLSDESLRRDLADMVQRGLLTRNGRKKGTHYTLAPE